VKYKNSGKGIDQIGKELRVDYVLEGSVREAASRVRIIMLFRQDDEVRLLHKLTSNTLGRSDELNAAGRSY
jgi:TolB-like protein